MGNVKARKITRSDFIDATDFIASLPPERQAKIAARTKELIAEELTLRELRKALGFTQAEVAANMGVGQEHVSRMEARSDVLLSTLASAIKSIGGNLKLVVELPDRPPVSLTYPDLIDAGDQTDLRLLRDLDLSLEPQLRDGSRD
jgi:transcriptional regulator with XRE-family HTH domain